MMNSFGWQLMSTNKPFFNKTVGLENQAVIFHDNKDT